MYLPNLTAYHTLENSQGTLDPLGLYSIADKLATRLVPGFRERMKHPRYLTAMAVGAVVCSGFNEDDLAVDEISAPWQVFEWYVASALVKTFEKVDPNQLLGLPGREKTTMAMKDNLPLSAIRYLKTPGVFGFHGVYRTLARQTRLMEDNQLGEFGFRLIEIWEKEQNLPGFLVARSGERGNELRRKLQEAVGRGLQLGQVAKPWTWEYYPKLANSLAPKSPGKIESSILFNELVDVETESRGELIRFLISEEGQQAFNTGSEKTFHASYLNYSVHNKELVLAIQAYEAASRMLYNAFYEIMDWMRDNQARGNVDQLSNLPHVLKAYKELPHLFSQADMLLEPYTQEASAFLENFEILREFFSAKDWVKLLIEHHVSVQSAKPPAGKPSWVLEHNSGSYLLNTMQTKRQDFNSEYIHQYRTYALQSFMKDLKKL